MTHLRVKIINSFFYQSNPFDHDRLNALFLHQLEGSENAIQQGLNMMAIRAEWIKRDTPK